MGSLSFKDFTGAGVDVHMDAAGWATESREAQNDNLLTAVRQGGEKWRVER